MKNHVRLSRLEKLKYMMQHHDELFPKVAFTIDSWRQERNSHFSCSLTRSQEKKAKKCGTAACALGSAAAYTPFRRMGLKLNKKAVPSFKRQTGLKAGAALFGISVEDAEFLFMPNSYPDIIYVSTRDVVRHITVLINHYKQNPDSRGMKSSSAAALRT